MLVSLTHRDKWKGNCVQIPDYPVAVSSKWCFANLLPLINSGRSQNRSKSEDLPSRFEVESSRGLDFWYRYFYTFIICFGHYLAACARCFVGAFGTGDFIVRWAFDISRLLFVNLVYLYVFGISSPYFFDFWGEIECNNVSFRSLFSEDRGIDKE